MGIGYHTLRILNWGVFLVKSRPRHRPFSIGLCCKFGLLTILLVNGSRITMYLNNYSLPSGCSIPDGTTYLYIILGAFHDFILRFLTYDMWVELVLSLIFYTQEWCIHSQRTMLWKQPSWDIPHIRFELLSTESQVNSRPTTITIRRLVGPCVYQVYSFR